MPACMRQPAGDHRTTVGVGALHIVVGSTGPAVAGEEGIDHLAAAEVVGTGHLAVEGTPAVLVVLVDPEAEPTRQ